MADPAPETPTIESTPKKKRKKRKTKKGKAASDLPVALMSKADAVRAALKEGKDKPADGVAFIKEKFGIDIGGQMFSTYKSVLAKKKGKKRGRPAGSKNLATSANGVANSSGGVISLIAVVRKLSDTYGAEMVGQVAKAFEK